MHAPEEFYTQVPGKNLSTCTNDTLPTTCGYQSCVRRFQWGQALLTLDGVSMLRISTWWVCSFFTVMRFWATRFASWSWWRFFKAFSRRRDQKASAVLQRLICLHFELSLLCVLVNQQKCSRIPLRFIPFDPLCFYAIFTIIRSCQNSTAWYPHYKTSLPHPSSDSAINETY